MALAMVGSSPPPMPSSGECCPLHCHCHGQGLKGGHWAMEWGRQNTAPYCVTLSCLWCPGNKRSTSHIVGKCHLKEYGPVSPPLVQGTHPVRTALFFSPGRTLDNGGYNLLTLPSVPPPFSYCCHFSKYICVHSIKNFQFFLLRSVIKLGGKPHQIADNSQPRK